MWPLQLYMSVHEVSGHSIKEGIMRESLPPLRFTADTFPHSFSSTCAIRHFYFVTQQMTACTHTDQKISVISTAQIRLNTFFKKQTWHAFWWTTVVATATFSCSRSSQVCDYTFQWCDTSWFYLSFCLQWEQLAIYYRTGCLTGKKGVA